MLRYGTWPAPGRVDLHSVPSSIGSGQILCEYYKHPLSRVERKPAFCICEKDADQLRGYYREADQRLCFRYTDSATSTA